MMREKDCFEVPNKVAATGGGIKCTECLRDLNSPMEWVCSEDLILCRGCYQGLLYPGVRFNYLESLD